MSVSAPALTDGKTQFDLLVVTANEVALWAMLDLMETMAETRTAATISSKGTRIRFAPKSNGQTNPFANNALVRRGRQFNP